MSFPKIKTTATAENGSAQGKLSSERPGPALADTARSAHPARPARPALAARAARHVEERGEREEREPGEKI